MSFLSILIATGILWGLTALVVMPLTGYLVGRKLQEPAYAHLNKDEDELSEDDKKQLESLATKYFILADVLVLGIAGFVIGLFGYYLIGIAFDRRGWPGMIAFIAASLTGVATTG
jgi:hypothetical protein